VDEDTSLMKWVYCNHCNGLTHHVCMAQKEYRHEQENGPDEWGTYLLWSCAGCDTCSMERIYSADFMIDENDKTFSESIFYPKRSHSVRPTKLFFKLPQELSLLYGQVVTSRNESLNILCAAGLRALIEGICADKGIAGRTLEKKIHGMEKLLPASIVENLHSFRFMGNEAVHELKPPPDFELTIALNVIEDVLNFLYELDYKAQMLTDLRVALRQGSNSGGAKDGPGQ
jgi:hypothetical protein